MEKQKMTEVLQRAVVEKGCVLVDLDFNDDDNVFVVTIDREGGDVELSDCEYVHRAVLDAFDRNVEDYSLTVTSVGISAEEADEMLKNE